MHEQLEDYLSKIEKQLAALPAEQREEELREIRSHLQQMIAENIARGDVADEAIAQALEQFGPAGKLGRDLKVAKPIPWYDRGRPLLAAIVAYTVLACIYGPFCSFVDASGILLPSVFHTLWLYNTVVIFSAFVSGWVAEIVAPQKAILPLAILYFGIQGFILFTTIPLIPFHLMTLMFTFVGLASFTGVWLRRKQVERSQRIVKVLIP